MKYLFLILSLFTLSVSAQTLMPVPSTPTTANINFALGGGLACSGTNTYAASISGLTTYSGFAADLQFANANTSTTTSVNINSLGAKGLKKYSSGSLVDLSVGDISSGARIRFYYNGSYMVMMGGSSSAGGSVVSGLGRSTTSAVDQKTTTKTINQLIYNKKLPILPATLTNSLQAFTQFIRVSEDTIFATLVQFGATPGDSDGAIISGSYSDNEGRSWSTPFQIASSGTSAQCPSIFKKANGTLVMLYLSFNSSSENEIRRSQSTDNGATWSASTKAYGVSGKYYAPSSDRIIKLKDGKWLYTFCEATTGAVGSTDPFVGRFLTSSDEGSTWTVVTNTITSPDGTCIEPGSYQFRNGVIQTYFRTKSNYVGFSNSDVGDVTTQHTFVGSALKAANGNSNIIYDSIKEVLIANHCRYDAGGPVLGIMDLSVSPDMGNSWFRKQVVDKNDTLTRRAYTYCIYINRGELMFGYAKQSSGSSFDGYLSIVPASLADVDNMTTSNGFTALSRTDGLYTPFLAFYQQETDKSTDHVLFQSGSSVSNQFSPNWLVKAHGPYDGFVLDVDNPATIDGGAMMKFIGHSSSGSTYAGAKLLAVHDINYTFANEKFSVAKNGNIRAAGGIRLNYVEKTGTYSVAQNDWMVNATSGSWTLTLPDVSIFEGGKEYVIKNTGSGTITLNTTSAQTINGAAPGTIPAGALLIIVGDGVSNWVSTLKMNSLAGTGTRVVNADASGNLSTFASDRLTNTASTSSTGTNTITWGDTNVNNGSFGSALFGESSEINTGVGSALSVGEGNYIAGYGGVAFGRGTYAGGGESFIGGRYVSATAAKTNTKAPQSTGICSFGFYITDTNQIANHGSGAVASAILGGRNANIPAGADFSVILGGDRMKLSSSDTAMVYVPNFRVRALRGATNIIADASGNIVASKRIAGSFTATGTATTTFTVTFGNTQAGTSYKVTMSPTSILAVGGYVTNKTTTTFDYVVPAATGTVSLDYEVIP